MLTALLTRTGSLQAFVPSTEAWPCVELALPAGNVRAPHRPQSAVDAQADALARAIEAHVKLAMGAGA